MVPTEEPSFDAEKAYQVWRRLIGDEELYRHTLAGTHASLRQRCGLDDETLAILDVFSSDPGTRWNVENLRFRAAGETGDVLSIYLTRTIKLLTRGDGDWLRDLSYEYLAHHQWLPLGQLRLTECERFAAYVRERIAKRRKLPEHFDAVLELELAVVRLLKRTAEILPEAWPEGGDPGDDGVLALRPKLSPAAVIVTLPSDLSDCIRTGELDPGAVKPGPMDLLVFVPSLSEPYRFQRLGEGPKRVLERCTGASTTEQLAVALEAEHDLDPDEVCALIRSWWKDRVLTG